MSQSISRAISNYTKDLEEVTGVEIASYLFLTALLELNVPPDVLEKASVAGPILWTGSSAEARDAIKRPIEDLLNDQEELFPEHFSAFLCIGKNPAGEWRYKRRRSCSQVEYAAGLDFLEVKAEQLRKKIDRYRADYNVALPFWRVGLSFAEAYRLAMEQRGGERQ